MTDVLILCFSNYIVLSAFISYQVARQRDYCGARRKPSHLSQLNSRCLMSQGNTTSSVRLFPIHRGITVFWLRFYAMQGDGGTQADRCSLTPDLNIPPASSVIRQRTTPRSEHLTGTSNAGLNLDCMIITQRIMVGCCTPSQMGVCKQIPL